MAQPPPQVAAGAVDLRDASGAGDAPTAKERDAAGAAGDTPQAAPRPQLPQAQGSPYTQNHTGKQKTKPRAGKGRREAWRAPSSEGARPFPSLSQQEESQTSRTTPQAPRCKGLLHPGPGGGFKPRGSERRPHLSPRGNDGPSGSMMKLTDTSRKHPPSERTRHYAWQHTTAKVSMNS